MLTVFSLACLFQPIGKKACVSGLCAASTVIMMIQSWIWSMGSINVFTRVIGTEYHVFGSLWYTQFWMHPCSACRPHIKTRLSLSVSGVDFPLQFLWPKNHWLGQRLLSGWSNCGLYSYLQSTPPPEIPVFFVCGTPVHSFACRNLHPSWPRQEPETDQEPTWVSGSSLTDAGSPSLPPPIKSMEDANQHPAQTHPGRKCAALSVERPWGCPYRGCPSHVLMGMNGAEGESLACLHLSA